MVQTMEINTGSDILNNKIQEWLRWDKNDKTRSEINDLLGSGAFVELERALMSRIQFGTAGLRGQMGTGYSRMNDLVIIQTSQGLAKYIKGVFTDTAQRGVVIGYDGRHNSRRFAELAVCAFVQEGIPVYLYSEMCPTPFVPFAVTQFGCCSGIMVTASHNPKDDNGYKVYWGNGAQIVAPHDKGIENSILKNLEPWTGAWDTSVVTGNSTVKDPLPEVMKSYYAKLQNTVLYPELNASTPVKFTFTPMHGVAYPYAVEAFKVAALKPFVVVEEQKEPHPDFPTVKFPNPEEGKSALDLSIQTANRTGCSVILANDPDADRLAVAEKLPTGEWKVFNGNELGSLLGWWCFYSFRKQFPDVPVSDIYVIASTVSSKMLRSIAKREGFHFEETLTGFKWMGNRAIDLTQQGKHVVFAFEEAIGYMCGTAVYDKDGISAAVRLAELVAFLQSEGKTLNEQLLHLYKIYGYHVSENSYYLCYKPAVVKKLFNKLRNFKGIPDSYPLSILGGKYNIASVRDLTTGYDSTQPDGRAVLPVSKSSQMITFTFENGFVATLRTSGTEPKIKYYTEFCAQPSQDNWSDVEKILHEMVAAVVDEFLQPNEYELVPRTA